MKFVLLLAVVLLVLWLVRGARRAVPKEEPPPSPVAPREDMVACSHCGLHLPRSDAVAGDGALFCSEAHRVAFERARR